jgi:thiamine pyrophosphokinase
VEGFLFARQFKRAVIFANGELDSSSDAQRELLPNSLIIAADGGGKHCLDLGIVPDLVVGDLDSLDPLIVAQFQAAGAEVIRYPERKDYTDLELALQYALERGAQEVVILAALGKRWDQTLANLLLPAAPGLNAIIIRLVDGPQEIQLLRPMGKTLLSGQPGDTISLIPLSGDACGITTQGLEYPLENGVLHFGSTRGVSNVLLGEMATISLTKGLLMCVTIHGKII